MTVVVKQVFSADVTIAACAHVAGTGVLHYDSDYDEVGVVAAIVIVAVASSDCATRTIRRTISPYAANTTNSLTKFAISFAARA
jgi:selenophosphate synthase